MSPEWPLCVLPTSEPKLLQSTRKRSSRRGGLTLGSALEAWVSRQKGSGDTIARLHLPSSREDGSERGSRFIGCALKKVRFEGSYC